MPYIYFTRRHCCAYIFKFGWKAKLRVKREALSSFNCSRFTFRYQFCDSSVVGEDVSRVTNIAVLCFKQTRKSCSNALIAEPSVVINREKARSVCLLHREILHGVRRSNTLFLSHRSSTARSCETTGSLIIYISYCSITTSNPKIHSPRRPTNDNTTEIALTITKAKTRDD